MIKLGCKGQLLQKFFSVTKPPVMVMFGKVQSSRINTAHTVTKTHQPFQQILKVGTKVLDKSLTLNLLRA